MTPGELNDAKKATWRPRMFWAFGMNKSGNPSGNFLKNQADVNRREKFGVVFANIKKSFCWDGLGSSNSKVLVPTYK
jgi:hypothetical protein